MRKRALLEPLLMFGLILAYIWKLRAAHPASGIAIRVPDDLVAPCIAIASSTAAAKLRVQNV